MHGKYYLLLLFLGSFEVLWSNKKKLDMTLNTNVLCPNLLVHGKSKNLLHTWKTKHNIHF